ncbi:MAG: hypothetical protein RTU92_01590 [Candidatus Thorarchaeota archaeon]
MEEIVCNGCSLLCDDTVIEIEGKELKSLGLCMLGHVHLMAAISHSDSSSSVDASLKKAADLLISAKNPLLFGFSQASNEAIKVGLSIAASLGTTLESLAELGLAQALQHDIHKLKLEADLDYARNNGEFVIYWGSNPAESSHRHPSRFTVFPRGEKTPEGIESRTIGVVDVRESETMKMANHRFIIPVGSDAELLDTIRGDFTGESGVSDSVLGISAQMIIGFVNALKKSDCTIIFYGSGLLNSGNYQKNLSALSSLIGAIRNTSKAAFALPMWHDSNGMGIVKTKPKSSQPTGLQKLISDETDVVLVAAEDPLAAIPGPAAKALAKKQIIYIGPPGGLTDQRAAVSIHTPDDVMVSPGSMTRVDMVDIESKDWSMSKNKVGSLQDVLSRLQELVKK